MRNYQPKKNNPYRLPHYLFYRMVYLVKDYERMKIEIDTIIGSFPSMTGNKPNKGVYSDPTGEKVVRVEKIRFECDAVDRALKMIPPEYRSGILNKICREEPYPITRPTNLHINVGRADSYIILQKIYFIYRRCAPRERNS